MTQSASTPDPDGLPSATPPVSVMAPAIRGTVWTVAGYAASQILRLASNLVLTRLLFPAVFGEMALVFIFLHGLQMFSDVGTGPAVIQNKRGDEVTFLNTAWTIQCARGVALWLASWLIAWPAAAFYDQPSLRLLIPGAGLTAVLGGFESTAMHALQRHLRLGHLTVVELVTQVVGTLATVLFALANRWMLGPSHPSAVWAIVLGTVTGATVRLILSHSYLPGIRNRFRFDRATARQLFGFGRWIFVSSLLTFLAGQADRLLFGKLISISLFGVYSIAWMLAALPTQAVLKLGSAVVFPAYSRVVARDDFPRLFWRARLPLLLGGAALVSALFAGGPLVVKVLYDHRYADAGWILQYLSVAAWFQILECTNGAALLAKGHVRWMAAGSAAKVLGMALLIPIGYRLGGFPGALAGVVGSEALKYMTAATGAALTGLRGFGRDALLTCAVACSGAAGHVAARHMAGPAGAPWALVASTAAVLVPWAAGALWYLRGERRVTARTA